MAGATGPATVKDVDHLEDLLSEPSPAAVAALAGLPGDVLVLGVGGKMGPTLARMAKRASELAGVPRRVIGVARFSDPGVRARLESWGVQTVAADLLDRRQLEALPDAPNVVSMTALKFGATGQEHRTWAMNCLLPAAVLEKYRKSRVVMFSTGNVYPLAPVHLGGSLETDRLDPVGEYGMSCLGRERVAEYYSRLHDTPVSIIRLNYANELRYGVLSDIAWKVWAGEPVDVCMGAFNAVWQGDANAMSLAAFAHASSPPFAVNVAGPETLSVRRAAERFGELLGRAPQITGAESPDALLSNAGKAFTLFGYPRVPVGGLTAWVADWVRRGGPTLGKPTHFEVRDGKF